MTAHESADGAPVEACDVRSQVTASVTTTFVLPPEAFTVVLPPPVMVSQVNVEHVFGIPQRTYLEILREPGCPIEVTPVGKLRLSETIEAPAPSRGTREEGEARHAHEQARPQWRRCATCGGAGAPGHQTRAPPPDRAAMKESSMGRRATGTTYESRGVWYASITVAQRKRESFAMPTCKTEEQAEARKDIVNDVVQRLRAAGHAALVPRFAEQAAQRPAGKELDRLMSAVNGLCSGSLVPKEDQAVDPMLYREIGEMWTSGEMERRYRGQVTTPADAKHIAGLLEKHVYPHIGEIPAPLIGPEHGQLVLNKYPEGNDPDSRRQVAKFTNRVMSLAASVLKIIPHNPFPAGWIPPEGPKKSRSCLYPPEDAKLMACNEVPLGLRLLWGYLHREGHRKNEVFSLKWLHFDLELGTINLEWNKTMQPRFWVLAPGVAAMLRAWKRYRQEVLGEQLRADDLRVRLERRSSARHAHFGDGGDVPRQSADSGHHSSGTLHAWRQRSAGTRA